MHAGILNFSNVLAGTLAGLAASVVFIRTIQFCFFEKNPDVVILPSKTSQTKSTRSSRLVLLLTVGLLLSAEFAIDYRTVWSRHHGDWDKTQFIAFFAWNGWSIAALLLAREFTLKRCGERGWIAMLLIGLIISFFML